MEQVLITGGAGFIGRALCSALLDQSCSIVVIDDLRSTPLQPPLGELRQKSVLDMHLADVDGIDTVYHLASHKSVPESFERPLQYLDNVDSGRHLLDLCATAGVRRVVVGSTCEVYGSASSLPTREDTPLSPRSPYAASKVALEMLAQAYQYSGTQPEVIIARFFNVFGPGERPDALIPRLCQSALVSKLIPMEGSGLQCRDLSFINDTVSKLMLLAHAPHEPVVNIGSGQSWSVRDIVAEVQKLVPDSQAVTLPGRRNEIAEFRADTSLMTKLGSQCILSTSVPDGIRCTLEWWKKQILSKPVVQGALQEVSS